MRAAFRKGEKINLLRLRSAAVFIVTDALAFSVH